ncbi:hypothetical protein VUJ46_02585 [Chryseobacterium sp. MYb264]|uniref:hypothetical protein n=1 Tax=Chryseobacterium sp. MYb264 TaxID=2745153 RepID=UPI002E1558C9|nr:hypothetical protein VUJ46_02585 [Chryseobacterium sp. MYb264]
MIKKAYYYFFYKIYKSIEYTSKEFGGKFMTTFKASLVLIVLQIWFLFSLGIYYAIWSKKSIELSLNMPVIYIPLLIIVFSNYYAIDYLKIWKEYNSNFDKLPKEKNKIGGWIVFGIILLIILNLIYSFYLMSQIDWSQYR